MESIAAALTPAMRAEIRAANRITKRPAGTWRALVRRGLATERRHDGRLVFELTDLGRSVADLLATGQASQ